MSWKRISSHCIQHTNGTRIAKTGAGEGIRYTVWNRGKGGYCAGEVCKSAAEAKAIAAPTDGRRKAA